MRPWYSCRNAGGTHPVGYGMTTTVMATSYGGPEALSVIDEPLPQAGPGQVRVSTRAIGTNPSTTSRTAAGSAPIPPGCRSRSARRRPAWSTPSARVSRGSLSETR
jgi:hypothetical protein